MLIKPETKRLLQVIAVLERTNTAKQIADKLGAYPSAITDLKKGRANVGNKLIQKFTKKYDVNPDWLFTGIGEMFLNREERPRLDNQVSFSKDTKDITKDLFMLNRQMSLIQREYDLLSKEIKIAVERIEKVEKVILNK